MEATAFGLAAATAGAMVFFAAVVAPTAFTAITPDAAGRFVRALFPRYYTAFAIASGAAAAAAAGAGRPISTLVLAAVAVGFLGARTVLMPAINRARDAGRDARFNALHRGSVILNFAQLAGLLGVLVALSRG